MSVLFFLLSPFVSLAQAPLNNECSGAKFITSNTTCISGASRLVGESLANATATTPTAPETTNCAGGGGSALADVWYKFTANSNSPTISLANTGTNLQKNNERVFVQLLSNSCGGTFASLACTKGNAATLSVNAENLTVGQDYYVRIATTVASPTGSGWGFDICITDPPPSNDDCSSPIVLSSATTCTTTTGNFYGSTASTTAASPCTGPVVYDLWYSFSAQTTNPTITLGSLGLDITSPRLQLFLGTCNGLTSLFCGTTSIASSGLTIGDTYYVRAYSSAGTAPASAANAGFTICVTDLPPSPPSNDDCANAIALTLGVNRAGTVWGATNSAISTVCSGTPDDDVWYKFTPTATSATIALSSVGSNLSTSGARIQVFSGSCGSLTSMGCGTSSITALGLEAGTDYYIRVYSAGAGSIGGTSIGSAFTITVTAPTPLSQTNSGSGRMNEVFQQTVLSGNGVLNYPWEVTYGPDNNLWVTESKGYKVYKIDPNTGARNMVLDISQGSTFFSAPDNSFNCQFANGAGAQGGLAGLALHPNFLNGTASEKNYVYISYIHSQTNANYFTNRLVRFTYNPATNRLESPLSLCDTLPGSNDHNSQRMIIAPVEKGGANYLFYASGDMGAGQFGNRLRTQKAQIAASYEGKILRFNLEPDTDAHPWIPSDNPYSSSSAVYSIGIRNNQGFAYDTDLNTLYGSSHGPYSDDEINIIEKKRNYGHPLVIGYVADGNYNGNSTAGTNTSVSAGAAWTDNSGVSSCPPIGNEATNRAKIDASGDGLYKDPLFSAYAVPQATVTNIWQTNPGNGTWPSEGWSGLELYTNKIIPGWKKSLVAAGLKWGRLVRLKLGSSGNTIIPTGGADTITYFQSTNRYRDLAFAPNGKDIYVVMDNNSATSGPGTNNPVSPACPGCLIKYTFLGYADLSGKSTIPTYIDVTAGTSNNCEPGTTVTIDNTNNNLWVPITGADGNIMAEIKANGNYLGTVTSSFYLNSEAVREDNGNKLYLDRNITITPSVQPASPVDIRLYLTGNELTALINAKNSKGIGSGVSGIANLAIFKNDDLCGPQVKSHAVKVIPSYTGSHGGNGFVVQGQITSFSTFYFGSSDIVALPLQFLSFKGALQNNGALLQWETANEVNTSHFVVERSINGNSFNPIGTVAAAGNFTAALKYSYLDKDAKLQPAAKLYYRLKQVDIDGGYSYSKTIVIDLNSDDIVSMHPNPVNDVLNIQLALSKAQQVQISVTDINGRTVYVESKFVNKGNSVLKVNTKAWPAQLYSIRITGKDNKPLAVQNLIKL
jgi:PQQ-dependent dehydrogenase (s-GDH family)